MKVWKESASLILAARNAQKYVRPLFRTNVSNVHM